MTLGCTLGTTGGVTTGGDNYLLPRPTLPLPLLQLLLQLGQHRLLRHDLRRGWRYDLRHDRQLLHRLLLLVPRGAARPWTRGLSVAGARIRRGSDALRALLRSFLATFLFVLLIFLAWRWWRGVRRDLDGRVLGDSHGAVGSGARRGEAGAETDGAEQGGRSTKAYGRRHDSKSLVSLQIARILYRSVDLKI